MGTVQIIKSFASIAQLVECSLGKAEVTGSIPVRSPRKGKLGTDSFFLFSNLIRIKNIEYKKMKRFCVSKFEIRNSKEKHEDCSFCLRFTATMREAHVFLVEFL